MLTPDRLEVLITAAREARERAYCPYSRFAVGAVVQTQDGRLFQGCNVENAAYPACICAERAALVSAYAAGERSVAVIAVIADTPGPVSPCGICRQVIAELAPQCTVVLANMRGAIQVTNPLELLPGAFRGDSLPER
jgi:cytidine deaminase